MARTILEIIKSAFPGRKLAKYADAAIYCPDGVDPSDLHVTTLEAAADLAKNYLLNR